MNIIIPIDNISDKNIYFHDPIKNTVINNGDFIRILYTDKYIISNGLQFKISPNPNKDIIEKIFKLEKNILNLYNPSCKQFIKLEEQLYYNISKYSHSFTSTNFFIIKISGIWENNIGIGVTSKIIYM